jgi:uncharacterized protein YqhQ
MIKNKVMKGLNIILFVFGLVVIIVLPTLHILSNFTGYRIITFKQYVVALILFLAAVYLIRKKETIK